MAQIASLSLNVLYSLQINQSWIVVQFGLIEVLLSSEQQLYTRRLYALKLALLPDSLGQSPFNLKHHLVQETCDIYFGTTNASKYVDVPKDQQTLKGLCQNQWSQETASKQVRLIGAFVRFYAFYGYEPYLSADIAAILFQRQCRLHPVLPSHVERCE